jgi:hypothetical protein
MEATKKAMLEKLEQEKQAVWKELYASKVGSKEEKILQEKYVDVSRRIRRLKEASLAEQVIEDCKRAENDTSFAGSDSMIPSWRKDV